VLILAEVHTGRRGVYQISCQLLTVSLFCPGNWSPRLDGWLLLNVKHLLVLHVVLSVQLFAQAQSAVLSTSIRPNPRSSISTYFYSCSPIPGPVSARVVCTSVRPNPRPNVSTYCLYSCSPKSQAQCQHVLSVHRFAHIPGPLSACNVCTAVRPNLRPSVSTHCLYSCSPKS